EFARVMLDHVNTAVTAIGAEVIVLSTGEYSTDKANVRIKEEGLNEALNGILPKLRTPVLIIISDLPIVRAEDLLRVVSTKADFAIVPGLGGGTNIMFIKHPRQYHVEYYGFSFRKHCEIAQSCGMTIEIIDSMRMSTDIDEPSDLVELLIHGTGAAPKWLLDHDFALSSKSGRLKVTYKGEEIA
ncbi:MAG TPA: 2-phospho-L-lactate guanylyltransferase, partial [Methanocorpusculum sp.]|nr:2-phospho-L-lactate guanylyltransferase [Methanocorpusculum sp.]